MNVFLHRKKWIALLVLKTFAAIIGLHYKSDDVHFIMKRMKIVRLFK